MLGQVGKYSEFVNISQQKYILCADIFSTSPEICFCSENIFICPRKYILCAEIFSTPPDFCFLLPENIFMFCGNCWTSPEFYSLPRKYLVHPIFFVSHARIFCFHARIFYFSHFGQALMPWLVKWSEDGIFGILDGVLNTCLWPFRGVWAETNDLNARTLDDSSSGGPFLAFKFLSTGRLLVPT